MWLNAPRMAFSAVVVVRFVCKSYIYYKKCDFSHLLLHEFEEEKKSISNAECCRLFSRYCCGSCFLNLLGRVYVLQYLSPSIITELGEREASRIKWHSFLNLIYQDQTFCASPFSHQLLHFPRNSRIGIHTNYYFSGSFIIIQ